MHLSKIKKANDIKNISRVDLPELCKEIRRFLIENISKTGGHLASNLGAVEITVALHYILDFPKDKLIFDVGHQAYVHKILTGRGKDFKSLRQTGGLSGFPDPGEDDTDLFRGGHASTAIGEGVGLCEASRIKGTDERIVVVCGDGSLTGGISFEALNNASKLKRNLTIILNDNEMSIGKNVGGVSSNIAAIRTSKIYSDVKGDILNVLEKFPQTGERITRSLRTTKDGLKRLIINNMFFEDLGIMYIGPVAGHDLDSVLHVIRQALRYKGPVVVHVITKKGKGYTPARMDPSRFHGIGPFDPATGETPQKKARDYTNFFSETMERLGKKDKTICAVTAAMTEGSGLSGFEKLFPSRFFDVGIAEEYGVILAASLAKSGLKPVVSIYSTFLQRSFDQVLMEVCLHNLPVVFILDRAGIVGPDGCTHQGVFDISYLTMMPNITVMAPKNVFELSLMTEYALSLGEPCAIRYPRDKAYTGLEDFKAPIEKGRTEVIYPSGEVLLLAYGSMVSTAVQVREILSESGITCGLTNARFAKPLDYDYLSGLDNSMIVTLEEGTLVGGFGMQTESFLRDNGFSGKILKFGVPDRFIPHGSREDILESIGLSAGSIAKKIQEALLEGKA